jgi:hypothetical protein
MYGMGDKRARDSDRAAYLLLELHKRL